MSDDITPNPNGTAPFGGDTEGENETVMRGIIASMVETLLNFLTTEEGYVFNTNTLRNTRKAADYKFQNQAVKHQALGRMASFMKIDEKKIMGYDLTVAGCSHLSVYFNDGQPAQKILMSSPLITKMLNGDSKTAKKFQRAAAAYIAFQEWKQASTAQKEEAFRLMRQRTGQAVEEVPEGMRLTPSVAAAAFNLEVGSPVRYFEVENHAMLRDSFHSMKADLLEEGKQFIDVSSHTLRTATLEKYSEKKHLTVNVHTLIDWFRSSVFPTARYCSPCGDSFGVQQSANGCPRCGNPKRNLGYNNNSAHLPFIESNQEGLKMVGGHRLLMKSFILRKPAFNALMDASKGLITASDALKVLLTYPVAIRKQMKRKLANGKTTTTTVKLKGRLVPAWYECVHATHKEDQFGLVVETMHKGEL